MELQFNCGDKKTDFFFFKGHQDIYTPEDKMCT